MSENPPVPNQNEMQNKQKLNRMYGMVQVMKVQLSCHQVLLSIESKTR